MASIREPPHLHTSPRFLLRHGFLHRRIGDGQRGGDGAMRRDTRQERGNILKFSNMDEVILLKWHIQDKTPNQILPSASPGLF